MSVPDLDVIRRPALEVFLKEQKALRNRDMYELLAPHFKLTKDDLAEMLPSGTQSRWHNRVCWACYDLYRAGVLTRPKRGWYQAAPGAKELLAKAPPIIDRNYLSEHYPAFAEFLTAKTPKNSSSKKTSSTSDQSTPEEQIGEALNTLEASLRTDLLEALQEIDPFRFEQIVVDLLFAMGYGGSREEAASVTKKSNDEGIDGVINEDRLGLDVIYVQAKRWQSTVGRKEIQSFVGALAGKQANKGVFISTSDFAKSATSYAASVSQKVVLIDGPRLADLMIEHNIGVSTIRTIELKRLDSDYFEGP
jgi:restriction system protein